MLVTRPVLPVEAMDGGLVLSLAYLVIFASCGALLFQNIGQKYTAPATAAVLLSLEAPFGVVFSILFADERPTPLMALGFVLIFVAVICSETKFSFLHRREGEGPRGIIRPAPGRNPSAGGAAVSRRKKRKQGVDKCPLPAYNAIQQSNKAAKPMTERSSRCS